VPFVRAPRSVVAKRCSTTQLHREVGAGRHAEVVEVDPAPVVAQRLLQPGDGRLVAVGSCPAPTAWGSRPFAWTSVLSWASTLSLTEFLSRSRRPGEVSIVSTGLCDFSE